MDGWDGRVEMNSKSCGLNCVSRGVTPCYVFNRFYCRLSANDELCTILECTAHHVHSNIFSDIIHYSSVKLIERVDRISNFS